MFLLFYFVDDLVSEKNGETQISIEIEFINQMVYNVVSEVVLDMEDNDEDIRYD